MATNRIITKEVIKFELKKHILPTDTILVHSSLSSLGYVIGGANAVIEALLETVPKGCLVMPSHTSDISDPSTWENPSIDIDFIDDATAAVLPFIKEKSRTFGIGSIPELFRTFPKVFRSCHPMYSLAAYGLKSDQLLANHVYDFPFGIHSPYYKLYKQNAKVLLIGTTFASNTCFHVSETLAKNNMEITEKSLITIDGEKNWITFKNVVMHEESFSLVGELFEKECHIEKFMIGNAICKLFSSKDSIDFGIDFFNNDVTCSTR